MTNKTHLPFVLLTHPIPSSWLSSLDGKCHLEVGEPGRAGFSEHLWRMLPETDGLITMLTDTISADVLTAAPHLKVISNYAAGLDNIDLEACTARKIPVGHTPGILTHATADMTMALLLAVARGIIPAARDAEAGRWHTWTPDGWLGKDLQGAVLGIFGMGKIGAAVAMRASAFGMHILYSSLNAEPGIETKTGAKCVPFVQLISESDFISLHVPLTVNTRQMFDNQVLQKMKPGSVLVNTSRGPVINMDALANALENGPLAAAALDVTDPEPLPPGHRLFSLPNCLIVPHIGSATHGTRRKMAELACDNLLAGLEGRHLPVCANPEVYI